MDGIIYFGDFFDFMNLEILKPESVDLILTDPPWFVKNTDNALKARIRTEKGLHIPTLQGKFPDYLTFLRETLLYFYKVLKKTGNCVIFYNFRMLPSLLVSLYQVGFKIHRDFVWLRTDKPGGKGVHPIGVPRGFTPAVEYVIMLKKSDKVYFDANAILDLMPQGRAFNYWISSRSISNFNFESEKPQELLRIFVRSMSPPGGIVFDPFLGTGSIIPVCIEEKRVIIGCEIDDVAQDMIKHRILEYPYAKIKIL